MSKKVAISVKNVSKHFKLPHEKFTGLKQALIHFRPGKKYDELQILKNISFEIMEGEFFGIVGRNGSGKSTLLKILAQIYTPETGEVQVNGSLTPFIELGVGFNPELTGRENVYMNGALLGFDRKSTAAMYDEIVEFAELHEFMDQKLKNYSSGMQVRLAFSIAIRAKSKILLIDEVLAVGDTAFQQKCFNYFEELKRGDTTVVLVTHDMSAVNRFCTRALVLENGRIKKIGRPDEVADEYVLENLNGNTGKTQRVEANEYELTAKISSQSPSVLIMDVDVEAQNEDDVYVGIAVIKDGISVAEITTPPGMNLAPTAKIKYSLDTSLFNSGSYQIGVALFRRKNRELLYAMESRLSFAIKGTDISRGGALKLENTWKARD